MKYDKEYSTLMKRLSIKYSFPHKLLTPVRSQSYQGKHRFCPITCPWGHNESDSTLICQVRKQSKISK